MHRNCEMRKFNIRINITSNKFVFISINTTRTTIPFDKNIRHQLYATTKYLIDRMQTSLIEIKQRVKLNYNSNNNNSIFSNNSNSLKMYYPASPIATNNNTSLIVLTVATTNPAPISSTTNFATKNVAAAAVAAVATNHLLLSDKNDTSSLFDGSDLNLTFTPAFSQVLLSPTSSTATSSNSSSGDGNSGIGTTTNETEPLNSFYFYQTEQLIVLWILFTVIVLGNSAVLITLFLNKNRKSRMNFFIKQLAIADLCVGLLNVLTDIIWRITVSWRAGNFACKLIRFLQASVTYASTYVLVALSIDRYDAITHPMNFSGSWKRARRLVAAAWLLSAIFSMPMLFLYEETLIEDQTQCWIELGEPWRWQIYMSLVSTVLFVVPALIISACYAIIVRTIWAKGAIYLGPPENRSRGVCNTTGNGYASGMIDRDRRASSRGIIPRAKVKTVKMTIVIVIVFVLCWSPYIVFDLLQVFQKIPKTQTNLAIATMIQSLAPLNSAANPLIYCMFSTQVCRALKRIPPFRWFITLWCCYGCDKTRHDHRSSSQTTIRCNANGQRMNNSNDSMRTLTTSLTVSRRSATYMRPARVVIVERPKTILAMSEV